MNSRENQIIKDFIMLNEPFGGTPLIDRLQLYRNTLNSRTRPYSDMPRQSARLRPQAQDIRHPREPGTISTISHQWNEHNPDMTDGHETANLSSEYKISVDVEHFTSEDLVVKVIGRIVIVKGQHEQRQEGISSSSRLFVKKYKVPENVDLDFMKCNLTKDKNLVITAPVREMPGNSYRSVPIQKVELTQFREVERPRQGNAYSEQRSQPVYVDLENATRPATAPRATAPPPPAHMQPNTQQFSNIQPRSFAQTNAVFQPRAATQTSADAKPRAAARPNADIELRAAAQLNVDIQSAIQSNADFETIATAQPNADVEPPADAQPNADSEAPVATQPNADIQMLTDNTNADIPPPGDNAAPEQI